MKERVLVTMRVSHSRTAPKPAGPTVLELWQRGKRRLARAKLFYGHGTDNPGDDAAALLAHALGKDLLTDALLARRRGAARVAAYEALLERRMRERIPSAYLTGRTLVRRAPDPRRRARAGAALAAGRADRAAVRAVRRPGPRARDARRRHRFRLHRDRLRARLPARARRRVDVSPTR
jgi:hypothetical protein